MKKIKLVILIFFMAICVFPVASCRNDVPQTEDVLTKAQLVDKVKYGVVEVIDSGLIGSGAVVEADSSGCIIVTNYHVINKAATLKTQVTVKFLNKGFDELVDADIIGYCKDYDVAVLKTKYVSAQVYAFKLEQNDMVQGAAIQTPVKVAVGQEILAAGYVGSQFCVYDGMVSCCPKFAEVNLLNTDEHLYLVETTALAPLGTSGGPCFDLNGSLVGLNAFSYTINDVMTGISYKVPANIISSIVSRVKNAEQQPISLAKGFVIHSDGMIVITCLGESIYVQANQNALFIIESPDSEYPVWKEIDTINGKSADILTLISELILTMNNTIIALKYY